jgi:hypothetical protein
MKTRKGALAILALAASSLACEPSGCSLLTKIREAIGRAPPTDGGALDTEALCASVRAANKAVLQQLNEKSAIEAFERLERGEQAKRFGENHYTEALFRCDADAHGVWARRLRVVKDGEKRELLVEIVRTWGDGSATFELLREEERDSGGFSLDPALWEVDAGSAADLDGDGVSELLVRPSQYYMNFRFPVTPLLRLRGMRIDPYAGLEGLVLEALEDVNGDGRADLRYVESWDGGYDAGCGGPVPPRFTPPLFAITKPDGSFDFQHRSARRHALGWCPRPLGPRFEEDRVDDVACLRLWGVPSRVVPELKADLAHCIRVTSAPPPPGLIGCGESPRDCTHISELIEFLKRPPRLSLAEADEVDDAEDIASARADANTVREARAAAKAGDMLRAAALLAPVAEDRGPTAPVFAELAYLRLATDYPTQRAVEDLAKAVAHLEDASARCGVVQSRTCQATKWGRARRSSRVRSRVPPSTEQRRKVGAPRPAGVPRRRHHLRGSRAEAGHPRRGTAVARVRDGVVVGTRRERQGLRRAPRGYWTAREVDEERSRPPVPV